MSLREKWEDFKARWFRREVRIAPPGTRGRVYRRLPPKDLMPGTFQSESDPTARLLIKVTRRNGDQEFYEVPSKVTKR